VAVIEVGGRGVRLLVAELLAKAGLRVLWTDDASIDLAAAVDIDVTETRARIAQAIVSMNTFIRTAETYRPMQTIVFGTEVFRKLSDLLLRPVYAEVPNFKVLSEHEEAELSFLAGVMGIPGRSKRDQPSLVIDQGSGSMEVVFGTAGFPCRLDLYRSYKLGIGELLKLLHQAGSITRFRESLIATFSYETRLASDRTRRPIVLGSAATRFAWLCVRPNPIASYDPRQVQGCVLRVSHIDKLIRAAESDPSSIRRAIDPRPGSVEFERVITGLVALEVFLRKENQTEFVVCADGTRYGLAWKLAFPTLSRSQTP